MDFDFYDIQKNCCYAIDHDHNERIVAFLTDGERKAWIGLDFLNREIIERKKNPDRQEAFAEARRACMSR